MPTFLKHLAFAIFCCATIPISGQTEGWNREISLSVVNVYTYLQYTRTDTINSTTSRSTGWGRGGTEASSLGLQFNYVQPISTRWAVGLSTIYTTRSAEEEIGWIRGFDYGVGDFDYIFTQERTYRLFGLESYLYLRLGQPAYKVSGLIGLGISYQYYYQEYLGGYVFNLAAGEFDARYITEENVTTFGIPLDMRISYAVTERFSIGVNGGTNAMFSSSATGRLGIHFGYHF